MKISAVIVTRGNVDMGPCLRNIDADEIIIRRGRQGIWERYEAAMSAHFDVIYTQDDDCVVDAAGVVGAYSPGVVTCNMPPWKRSEYPDGIALVGWGAVFDRQSFAAFERYQDHFMPDGIFHREADRVFTGLNKLNLVNVPFEHLPWAHGKDRMGTEPQHGAALQEIRRRIQVVRNG